MYGKGTWLPTQSVAPRHGTHYDTSSLTSPPQYLRDGLTNLMILCRNAPSGVSQDLVESLQTSAEVCSHSEQTTSSVHKDLTTSHLLQTDASRAQIAEIQVQARVAEELKKLQAKATETLKEAHAKVADGAPNADDGPSRQAVSKEVEALRAKLESRKKLREIPESVETARSEVVRCLRENDRRPLDCWKEVERFKAEVKRLEETWVEKVVS